MTRRIGMLAAVLLALAACSSATTSGGGGGGGATPDPSIAFCDALDSYGATLADFEALTPAATVDEYKAAGAARKGGARSVDHRGSTIRRRPDQRTDDRADPSRTQPSTISLPCATPAEAEVALDPPIKAVIQQVVATHNASCNTRPTPSTAPRNHGRIGLGGRP